LVSSSREAAWSVEPKILDVRGEGPVGGRKHLIDALAGPLHDDVAGRDYVEVVPGTTHHGVDAQARAGHGIEHVIARTSHHRIVAVATVQLIVPVSAVQRIVAAEAAGRVVARQAGNGAVAFRSRQTIVARRTRDIAAAA